MAVRVALPDVARDAVDRLVVLGVRAPEGVDDRGSPLLARLLEAQRYTRGVAVVQWALWQWVA